ncbi:MAG: Gfo/Idh/MocA family oxidoreductase [Acidimicrobiales bacterium]
MSRPKARIERGDVGEVVLVESAFLPGGHAPALEQRPRRGRRWRAHRQNGTHSVDLIRYLLGPIAEVMAVDIKRVQHLAVEDTARMVLRSEVRVMAAIGLSWSIDKSSEDFLTVYGSEGGCASAGAGRGPPARRCVEPSATATTRSPPCRRSATSSMRCSSRACARPPRSARLASVAVIEAAYASMAACAWRPVSAETVGTAGNGSQGDGADPPTALIEERSASARAPPCGTACTCAARHLHRPALRGRREDLHRLRRGHRLTW